MTLVNTPTYTEFIDQKFVVEPLVGPKHPSQYTDRFPDDLYHKSPESHLIRFLYTLLGPSGVGWLRKNVFETRLQLEAQGIEGFDLEAFYGDPFAFGRIVDEMWDQDPTGVLPHDEWQIIRTKDEAYRSRAIDFMNAGRAGNTPLGMKLAARSGLGHEVEIVENYKYLFDQFSDDPIGFPYYGKTDLANEMIILPRKETPLSEAQRVTITGNPTGGNFTLVFNGQSTAPIAYDADQFEIEAALRDLSSIGPDGVAVYGGANTFEVRFLGVVAATDVPELTYLNALTGGLNPDIEVETITNGRPGGNDTQVISARDRYALQTAVDRIKSMTTIPSIVDGKGVKQVQEWRAAHASSEYNEVIRYVSGNPAVLWPQIDRVNWVQKNIEKEAPRIKNDLQYHYVGFHNLNSITSSSYHTGQFSQAQRRLVGFNYLSEVNDDLLQFVADRALADYSEPLTVGTSTDNEQFINGIYPTHYLELAGVPEVKYKDEQYWASIEASEGEEWLELDLGSVQAVNFIAMEISKKPIDIIIEHDTLDQGTKRYEAVQEVGQFPGSIVYEAIGQSPWQFCEFHFQDSDGTIPFTRYIKIRMARRIDSLDPFLFDSATQTNEPWSIEVRNLRIGRNVSDY